MAYGQPRPKLDLTDARTGDPIQREAKPAGTVTEAIDRRTVRQAIMTQLLTEVADEIIKSGKTLTKREDGKIVEEGTLRPLYENDKNSFPLLRALIANPEVAFNTRRNKLFGVSDPSVPQPFGAINLVVFRSALALGDGNSPVDPEEVAKRVVIRAGRSSGYRDTHGFAGCK